MKWKDKRKGILNKYLTAPNISYINNFTYWAIILFASDYLKAPQ